LIKNNLLDGLIIALLLIVEDVTLTVGSSAISVIRRSNL
jgi:hypothetical protein